MSNMSYCRFQNTLEDLLDCADALYNDEKLSPEEERAKAKLIAVCGQITEDCGDDD